MVNEVILILNKRSEDLFSPYARNGARCRAPMLQMNVHEGEK